MRLVWRYGVVLLLLLGTSGCRARVAAPEETPAAVELPAHLGEQTEVSLADWLQLPREQLAQLGKEWQTTVEQQQRSAHDNPDSVLLLPHLHVPETALVLSQADFSQEAGMSLPPYLKPGQQDAALALHLARLGDREAALRLAPPHDRNLHAQIERYRGERSYPLEWTRLVSLALESAQLKLASGDASGASDLVLYHRQLHDLLDSRAARGPLGAALLPAGRRALQLAAQTWRESRQDAGTLIEDIEAALAEWGPTPAATPLLVPGASRDEVARVLPAGGRKSRAASSPPDLARALDLLELPVPAEGAQAVLAFLDDRDRLAELLVVYRPRSNELFREPAGLALALIQTGAAAHKPTSASLLQRQTWAQNDLSYEISLLPQCRIAGALARIEAVKPAAGSLFERNPRDFGALSLDRSFSQNRLGLVPEQQGEELTITQKPLLSQIALPPGTAAPAEAQLQREPGDDLVASLTLSWSTEGETEALAKLLLPLWLAYGSPQVEAAQDSKGDTLLFTWQDARTRAQMHLHPDARPAQLVVSDARGQAGLAQRRTEVAEHDQRERVARLQAGHPRKRLPRLLDLNNHQVAGIHLGMTRQEVQDQLPAGEDVRTIPLKDGMSLVLTGEAAPAAPFWARQLFFRFGPDNRLDEMRVRYQFGPGRPSPTAPALLDTLIKAAGPPDKLPAPWQHLWTDLPGRHQAVFYRWQDDLTVLTYQRDKTSSEVIYRSCPPDQPAGSALPPLEFCSRGVDACKLGASRGKVLAAWKMTRPPTVDGADVLSLRPDNPYDVLLVWYENGQVSRIVARHRSPSSLQPAGIPAALQEAWARSFDELGYLRRQDAPWGVMLQSYSWHDDRTRVRIFAQQVEGGPRLFTEWRRWPISAASLAADSQKRAVTRQNDE